MAEPLSEEAISHSVLSIPTAEERARFLERACGGDESLRSDVERLLSAHGQSGRILERPVDAAAGLAKLAPSDEAGGDAHAARPGPAASGNARNANPADAGGIETSTR
jgi:hypothetical protein